MPSIIRSAAILLAIILLLAPSAVKADQPDAERERLYQQTGFAIKSSAFLNFFDRRGGLRTFGYPVSREFILTGFRVQFFQRAILQLLPDGSVTTLNLLDAGLMPYTRINQSTLPAADPGLLAKAPSPGSPGYGSNILAYVQANAPDTWQGLPVNFHRTFMSTVSEEDAFPGGEGDAALLAGFNLELWGIPTSPPAFDPANDNFVYQRFQRGIMHYDKATNTTQGLLLADYLKRIIIGNGLPSDLEAQAKNSPLYRQYDSRQPRWVARPNDLPESDLTLAFEREGVTLSDRGPRETVEQKEFLAEAIPLAQASQKESSVPASVTLAQAILDTGWGASELAVKGKNYFGIKSHRGPGTAGVIVIKTSEYVNGQWITVEASFRAYHTMEESFADHGRYLAQVPIYRTCFETKDPREFARRLQAAGYATDPTYADKLIRIMDQYNLYAHDLTSG